MKAEVIDRKFNMDFDHVDGKVTLVYNIEMVGHSATQRINNPSKYLYNSLLSKCQEALDMRFNLMEDHVGLTLIID